VPHELVPEGVLPSTVSADCKLLVISHDCDVVNPSYESEPFCEILVLRPQSEPFRDSRVWYGKNPRKLQLRAATASGESQLYEINIHEKYRLDRHVLESGSPDATIEIEERDVKTIAKWAARRYERPSFPSAFVDRVPNPVRKNLLKLMKRDGEDVLFVLAGSDRWDELSSREDYRITLRVVMSPDACEDYKRELRGLSVVAEMRSLLSQCEGIQVEDADIANTAELTIEEYLNLRRWDFDYLSPDDEQV